MPTKPNIPKENAPERVNLKGRKKVKTVNTEETYRSPKPGEIELTERGKQLEKLYRKALGID